MSKVIYLMMLVGIFMTISCTDGALTTENKYSMDEKVESRSIKATVFEFPEIQWEAFETHGQKLAACEIPDSILPMIPTEELVEICMKYPMLLDAYAFNTPLQGIKIVASRFNGFKELMKREDNCFYVFKYLIKNDIRNVDLDKLMPVDAGRTTLVYILAEYVLSFDHVICNATEDMKDEIASFAYEVLEKKESDVTHHALGSLTSSMYLWINTLSNKTKARSVNPTIEAFLESGMIQNRIQYLEIKKQCQTLK